MKHLLFILALFSLLLTQPSFAQEKESTQEIIERIAESYADDYSEEIDLTPYIEDLERILEAPLNINNASRSDFEQLHFLSSFQIEKLLAYRKQVGQIFSIYELPTIEGFTTEVVANLKPFVLFLPPDETPKTYLQQEIDLRYNQVLEKASGFIANENGEKAYSGIRPAMLLKYRAQKGEKLKFGLTADNDSGENFFGGSNPYGFDFYSAYFGYQGKKLLKQVYLGDYQVKTGQGLIQWSNYGIRKSVDATNVRQTGQGLRANTSTDENNYLRGAAASFELGNLELVTYYSNTNVDANILTEDASGKVMEVSSLQTSGYHRTEGEQYDENALNIQLAGANLKYRLNRFSIGLNGVYSRYNAPLVLSDQLYNAYNFNGEKNYNVSTDFLWVLNRINFFGEAAMSESGGKAILTGLEAQPANEVAFSLLYRNYAPDFHSIHGTSFGESSKNSNEKGLYTGLSVYPFSHIKVSSYLDVYDSYWMKYSTTGPVHGTDMVLQTDYTPTEKLNMYIRLKSEKNSEKSSDKIPVRPDLYQQINRARFQINWQAAEFLELRFRTEWSGYTKGDSTDTGLLVFADVLAQPVEKLSVTARLAWFNTDNYDSRIYAYENDVPQYFYIPAFYNKGLRYYLNCRYRIAEGLTAYLKVSQLLYFDKTETIGSGNSAINDHKKTDFKLFLKYRF